MTQNIFQYISEDFFKPLTSKYKKEYAVCIGLIFSTFQSETSYGINRETVITVLENYFDDNEIEMYFEETETRVKNPRDKANEIVTQLKKCGWIEYESVENHQINLLLNEYAVPIIECFNKIVKEEETEYQGIISQIYSTLYNEKLYTKPYELILKGVYQHTERLLSELKKLSASIKRHMEKQTNEMKADQVLEHLFSYQKNIGSKAYLRMKTSENVFYFKCGINSKLDDILSSPHIMDLAVRGYMELEATPDSGKAEDEVIKMILDVKSSFHKLNDIIEDTDRKHARCIRHAVMRAKFLLSSGNNMEEKILQILNSIVEDMNEEEHVGIYGDVEEELLNIFHLYPQKFMDVESLKTIPVAKKLGIVNDVDLVNIMTVEERELYKQALRCKNQNRFTRKNINAYAQSILEHQDRVKASSLPIENRRDLIRIIYLSIYGNNKANTYTVERSTQRVKLGTYEIPDFEIIRN